MQKNRIKKEILSLDNSDYQYLINNNDNNCIIWLFSNKGEIEIELPSGYPFVPPRVHIYSNLTELNDNNLYLYMYLNRKLTPDISRIIIDYVYNEKNKIHIKKYFYDKISKYNSNDCFDVILDFDKILQTWSPVYKITNIIEFLLSLNNKYKIKDKYKLCMYKN